MRITSKDVRERLAEVNRNLADEPGSKLQLDLQVWGGGEPRKFQLTIKGTGNTLTPTLRGREMYDALGTYVRIRSHRKYQV